MHSYTATHTRLASAQGHADAQAPLGSMHLLDQGGPLDFAEPEARRVRGGARGAFRRVATPFETAHSTERLSEARGRSRIPLELLFAPRFRLFSLFRS